MSVECSSDATVVFKLVLVGQVVPLGQGVKSKLEVDSKPLGSQIMLPLGISTLSISSALQGVPVVGGQLTGFSVLIIEIL